MRKSVAIFAASVFAALATTAANAQSKPETVVIRNACVYQTLLMCKAVDGPSGMYDVRALRRQPNVGQRINLIGRTTGTSPWPFCGKQLAANTIWWNSPGKHIPCPPRFLF